MTEEQENFEETVRCLTDELRRTLVNSIYNKEYALAPLAACAALAGVVLGQTIKISCISEAHLEAQTIAIMASNSNRILKGVVQ